MLNYSILSHRNLSSHSLEFLCLEVGFEKFFDSHMQNYIAKLKIVKWNRFDTDCEIE